MGRIHDFIAEEIRERLNEVPVLVWYDADRSFGACFAHLQLNGVLKLAWRHGPLELRRQAEPVVRGLRDGERPPQTLLIYVPSRRQSDRANALLPLEALGGREERSLADFARGALIPSLGAAKVESWLSMPGLTLETLEELASADSTIGALQAVFGPVSPREVGLEILRDPDKIGDCSGKRILAELKQTLQAAYGISLGAAHNSAEGLADAFVARVLLTEFLTDLTAIPSDLEHLLPLPESAQVEACRDLAARLRADRTLEMAYRQWAERTCDRLGLARLTYEAEQLGVRDTFRFEAEYALKHAKALGRAGHWNGMREWIERRASSYWSLQDPSLAREWEVLRLVCEVARAADHSRANLPGPTARPSEWVERYVDDGPAGLWRVDRLARRLDAIAGAGDDVDEVLIDQARESARSLEQLTAERFADGLMAASDPLAGLPEQTDVVRDYVIPAARGQKVALIIADALRYEMARDLEDTLSSTGEVRVQHAIAALPSITRIGMAALTPPAADGVALVEAGGKVTPRVGGAAMTTVDHRMQSFTAVLGGRFKHVTLDDLLPMKRRLLQDLVASVDLLVVRSGEIDAAGEQDTIATARQIMGHLLEQLHQAMQRLAAVGIERFFVVADHGFLMREDINAGMVIDPPAVGAIETHRRFAIGRGLSVTPHTLAFKVAALHLGGDLEIVFPRGINVFRTPGNLAYLHGGVSLQELVVPILWYTPVQVPAKAAGQAIDIALKDEGRITNRLFAVVLSYEGGGLFEQESVRWFRVTGHMGDAVKAEPVQALDGYRTADGAVGLKPGSKTVVMMQAPEIAEGSGKLELWVTDVDAGETVKKRKVDYEFAF